MNKKRLKNILGSIFYPLVSIAVFLLIWYYGVSKTDLSIVMPTPIPVIKGFLLSFVEPIGRHTMKKNYS